MRGYGIFKSKWRFDWPVCAEIIRLGIPVAALVFLEAGLFVATAILSGVIGAKTLAAYEVVMSWVGIPFVLALGMAEATMVLVAHAVGRRQPRAIRRVGYLGMTFGVGLLSLLVIVPLGLADQIVSIFITPADPGFTEVTKLATQFLMIAAIFQVFDGLQAIAARPQGQYCTTVDCWIRLLGFRHRRRFATRFPLCTWRCRSVVGSGYRPVGDRVFTVLALLSIYRQSPALGPNSFGQ